MRSSFDGLAIECIPRRFDGKGYSDLGEHTVYEFASLSQTAPHNGNVIANESTPGGTAITHTWTLSNGIYFGPTDLAAHLGLKLLMRAALHVCG